MMENSAWVWISSRNAGHMQSHFSTERITARVKKIPVCFEVTTLTIFTTQRYMLACYMPSSCAVCLSMCVCLSITRRYCIKTPKPKITQTTPHDSPVFVGQRLRRN